MGVGIESTCSIRTTLVQQSALWIMGGRLPNIWLEKTIVEGRPDRDAGPHSLGRALWSPAASKNGRDIYHFMREVMPGDAVLHLTDNKAITGTSTAASSYKNFEGLRDTTWGEGPSYRIALRDYNPLDPPLSRDTFFSGQYGSELVQLLADGERHLFYNGEPSLNQGAYLTPVPPRLFDILNRAYLSQSGKELLVPHPINGAPTDAPDRNVPGGTDVKRVVDDFQSTIRHAGLILDPALVRSFVVSLLAKRFAILTGLSGSGKTQIALRLGEWLGPGRYLLVPVRPDWTGSESLFGYEDALLPVSAGQGRAWHVPQALEFMLKAASDPENPYVLILDEMNLAHVERYFADALSGIESGEPCLPNLQLSADDPYWRVRSSASAFVPMPENLFIVGTVNVDETTYLFSSKVLDRANTFEFRVRTSELDAMAGKPSNARQGDDKRVASFLRIATQGATPLAGGFRGHEEFASRFKELHALLLEAGIEFGHRVYFEAMRFASIYAAAGGESVLQALDLQVMQKILPRIHGSRKKLEGPLRALGQYCADLTTEVGVLASGGMPAYDPLAVRDPAPKLPISFDKVRRMLRTLRLNQFTSFTD